MKGCRLVTLGVLIGLVGVPVAPTAEAQELETQRHERVTMIFTGGDSCVAVDKMRATIHRSREPKRVEWAITVPGRYWEIRYQETSGGSHGKPEGRGDFFSNSGDLDIGCSQLGVRSELPAVLGPVGASWPYMIKVYECTDGVKGDLLCELDPIIDWDD